MPPKAAARGEYIETETGNKISRRASILGPKHIILAGKCVIQHDVIIHGDLVRPQTQKSTTTASTTSSTDGKPSTAQESVSIHLGRYVFVSPHVTLHPPSRLSITTNPSDPTQQVQTLTYHPLRIADDVYIGPHTHIQAATIGSHVHIGTECTIGNLVIIKDNVRIEDRTVLPAGSVWASGIVVAGRPGQVVGELGEAWGGFEGIGTSSRERWASVGNKR